MNYVSDRAHEVLQRFAEGTETRYKIVDVLWALETTVLEFEDAGVCYTLQENIGSLLYDAADAIEKLEYMEPEKDFSLRLNEYEDKLRDIAKDVSAEWSVVK